MMTKAQRYFKKLDSSSIGLSNDIETRERERQAYDYWLKEFGTLMYELALQGKLFTIQKVDGAGYLRCVDASKE